MFGAMCDHVITENAHGFWTLPLVAVQFLCCHAPQPPVPAAQVPQHSPRAPRVEQWCYQHGMAHHAPLKFRFLHMHMVWRTLSTFSTFIGSLRHPKKNVIYCYLHLFIGQAILCNCLECASVWSPYPLAEQFLSCPPCSPSESVWPACCCLQLLGPSIVATGKGCQRQCENRNIYRYLSIYSYIYIYIHMYHYIAIYLAIYLSIYLNK